MSSEPRVLIFQHNPMSRETANGKTLGVFFSQFSPQNLAQIYVTAQKTDTSMCGRFFHIAEKSMLKKHPADTTYTHATNVTSTAIASRRRPIPLAMPYITIFRDWLWRQNRWDTLELKRWIDDFAPDCLFFSGGNIASEYDIAVRLCQRYQIPMILHIGDDYFTYKKHFPILQCLYQNRIRRCFRRTYDFAKCVVAISGTMKEIVINAFGGSDKHYVVAMNAIDSKAVFPPNDKLNNPIRITYAGNLGLDRMDTIFSLCDALKILSARQINIALSLYSHSNLTNKQLQKIRSYKFCKFEGAVEANKYAAVVKQSDIMLHIESFRRKHRKILESGFSTKTPELLSSGRPALIIGPEYSSTVKFFVQNKAGTIILTNEPLEIANAIEVAVNDYDCMRETAIHAGRFAISQFGRIETGNRVKNAIRYAIAKQ